MYYILDRNMGASCVIYFILQCVRIFYLCRIYLINRIFHINWSDFRSEPIKVCQYSKFHFTHVRIRWWYFLLKKKNHKVPPNYIYQPNNWWATRTFHSHDINSNRLFNSQWKRNKCNNLLCSTTHQINGNFESNTKKHAKVIIYYYSYSLKHKFRLNKRKPEIIKVIEECISIACHEENHKKCILIRDYKCTIHLNGVKISVARDYVRWCKCSTGNAINIKHFIHSHVFKFENENKSKMYIT